MNVKKINYRGRKSRLGAVLNDGGRVAFFGGYHTCSSCGERGKIIIGHADIVMLRRRFGVGREPIGARITRRLSKHYDL
ncbi:MAG TPA: hypothetical protein VF575_00595 [Candidatus Saccharimonadales bacterium]|jgi:hypothetical protein